MAGEKTLIAFATKGGTTEGYANAIASVLREEFMMGVDLINLGKRHDPDLAPYRNLIVGTGVRIKKVYGDATSFLERDFGDRKVAIYFSSLDTKEVVVKEYLEKILQQNAKLKPIAVEVFGGRMRLLGKTVQDKVDLDKAKEWARGIARQLQV
jgi:menaquinone-dependent protoporphyrinogen IX oxidase